MSLPGEPRRSAVAVLSSVVWSAIVVALVALLVVPTSAQQKSSGGTLRGLYVTGGGFHDFVKEETILPPGIAQRADITWTIDNTAGTSTETLIDRHKDTAWTKAFDVVVYNMSFSHVVDVDWIERLAHAHRDSGVPAVIVHGAVHSYRRSTTRAWGELMGAFSMRHDSQRPLTVKIVATGNPIMEDVPDPWTTSPEELYELERVWPSMTPLAEAYSVETKKSYPVVWTNTYGKARVFVISLGHNPEMMATPAYLDVVSRGLLWAVNRLPKDGTAGRGASRR